LISHNAPECPANRFVSETTGLRQDRGDPLQLCNGQQRSIIKKGSETSPLRTRFAGADQRQKKE
jgi:hypothetical protein